MSRSKGGLEEGIRLISELRQEFEEDVCVPGAADTLNQSLELAGRVADFFELGELMCRDALAREESCGGHFREEHQYPDGEAMRNDEDYGHVSAWEWKGKNQEPELHKEKLEYEAVKMVTRSYK